MVRLLVVTNMYPPHHYGGYELVCRDVVDSFRQRGHDVTVLTTTLRVPGAVEARAGDERQVRRELEFYWKDHELDSPSLRHRVNVERSNQRALRAALAASRPDVVSVWNMGAMSLGLLTTLTATGIPLVYNIHDDWLDYAPHLDAWMRLFRGRPRLAAVAERCLRLPAHLPDLGANGAFCFVSEHTRGHALNATPWSYLRSAVVHSGIDRRDFPPQCPSPPRPWSWRLLYVGRIDRRKGIETIVRALPSLPEEAFLTVLGQGEAAELTRLAGLCRELGVERRVSFESCERAQLRSRYQQADAVVFPSTWAEPFGLVPIEAMACGVPVAATGRGGSGEFLADGVNCLLYPAGDAAALAAVLARLAGDRPLRSRLTRSGLATADELTATRCADQLEAWHLAAAARFAQGDPSC